VQTPLFTLEKPMIINSSFAMPDQAILSVGPIHLPIPFLGPQTVDLHLSQPKASNDTSLVGKDLPDFSVGSISNLTFRGQSSILSFMPLWSPQINEQLEELGKVTDPSVQVVVIVPQESEASVDVFKKRGGYNVTMIADPDGVLTQALSLYSLPKHLFISRKGVVERVESGALNKEELVQSLVH
jgi:peroxiredoxin